LDSEGLGMIEFKFEFIHKLRPEFDILVRSAVRVSLVPNCLASRVLFTARCYASAVLAMTLCPSVCPSVRHKSVFY